MPLDGLEFLKSIPRGVGQAFFAGRCDSGLIITFALLICSPISAVMAVLASLVGAITAICVGVEPLLVYQGLWGYNR